MYRADIVNVLGSDQRMRLGRIVDTADGGLVVDLLCSHRHREFAPFQSVFLPRPVSRWDLARFSRNWPQTTVPTEILVPETARGSWMWLMGEMSGGLGALADAGGAVVHWQSPDSGMRCTDMVPISRLRPVWDAAHQPVLHRRIGRDTFIKHSLQLDKAFLFLSRKDCEELIQRLNGGDLGKYSPVFAVDLVDGQLQYIHQCGYQGLYPRPHGVPVLGVQETLDRFQAILLSVARDLPFKAPATALSMAQMALPAELWQDVFSYLDTAAQTKLRVVCTAWSRILEAPALRSTIVIQRDDDTKGRSSRFLRLATVFKCLRPGTQRVILTHRGPGQWMLVGDADGVLEMIRYAIEQQPGIRLRSVHLHRITLDCIDVCNYEGSTEECDQLRTLQRSVAGWRRLPCDRIHITSGVLACTFSLCRYSSPTARTHVEMEIRSVRLPPGADIVGGFMDAMEAGLPVPDEQKLRQLLRWLNGDRKPKEDLMRQFACQMLCALQSADPRPASHYRGKTWCVDGMKGVQLEKLSRITRHCLAQLRKWTARDGW